MSNSIVVAACRLVQSIAKRNRSPASPTFPVLARSGRIELTEPGFGFLAGQTMDLHKSAPWEPGGTYRDRIPSAVRKLMSCLGLGIVLIPSAACGESTFATPAPQSSKYNQTWTKSYGLTICRDWNDEMTDSQQWVAAADMLTGARSKRDGDEGRPSGSLVTRFQADITAACSVDDSQQLPEIAVGVYLVGRDRYSP